MKRYLFVPVLLLLIACSSGQFAFAQDHSNGPNVFDQALMDSLLNQGYAWDDLIQASILAHQYKVPLQSLLDLHPEGSTWEQVEVALMEMDHARKMLRDKSKLKEDHTISWLVKKGFTDEEIALLSYNASLSGEPLTRAAGKAMQELDQRGGKKEKRIDFGFTTPTETMALASTMTSTVTYDDPGLGYDAHKCSPCNRLMQSHNEVINPASGSLQIAETDLVLSGKNGLDFSLTRIYQSEKSDMNKTGALFEIGNVVKQSYTANVYCQDEFSEHYVTVTVPADTSVSSNNTVRINVPAHTYAGVQHLGFIASVPAKNNLVVTTNTYGENHLDGIYHLGTGWGWALPSIETGARKSYLHTGTGATYQLVEEESKFNLVGVENNEYTFSYYTSTTMPGVKYVLKHKSGINYYFNASKCLILIQNQFGNSITLKWSLMNYSYVLTEVVDTVGRVIKFDYSFPTEVKVTVGSSAGAMVIRYIKALELYQNKLVQVILPEGITTNYTYLRKDEDLGVQDDPDGVPMGVSVKSYLLLTSITNPYKGTTTYNYSTHSRRLGYNNYEKYYKLSNRYDMANGKKLNNLVYTYQDHDKYPYPMDPTLDYTYIYTSTIDYGNRTEVYTYDGINHLNTSVETRLKDNLNYKETKTISYNGHLPHITTVTKEDTSSQEKPIFNTTTEYDSYGNLIFSQDSVGHTTESSYLTKSREDTKTSFQVVDWTREKVNPDATGNMMYVGSDYEYDAHGNVQYVENKEWYTTWSTVTENLGSQRLTSTGTYYQKTLPAQSSQVVLKVGYFGAVFGNHADYEVRYWATDATRPTTPYASKVYAGGTFGATSGTDVFTIPLNSSKQYYVEVKATRVGGLGSVVNVTNVDTTYLKPVLTGKTKSVTYFSYANPVISAMPNKMHTEYGTLNSAHAFTNDNCVKTEYQYLNSGFEGAFTGENYDYVAPTKITQYYTDANGAQQALVTNLKYNRHGSITKVTKGTLENQYVYDGYDRLKTEIYRDTASTKVLQKDYVYTTPATSSQYATTTITHQENVGTTAVGKDRHVTKFNYNGMGQLVETRKGPNGELLVQTISYDSYGRQEYVIDGIGLKTQTLYDGFNRPVEVRMYDKAGTYPTYKKNTYNDLTNQVTEEIYDLKNGVYTKVGKTVQQMDKGGRVLSVDQYPQVSGTTYYRTSYMYNLTDQVISMTTDQVSSTTNPRRVTLKYEYDFFGLTKVDYPDYSGAIRADDVYVYEYPGNKKQVKKQISGATIITTEYDELDRVKKMTDADGRIMMNYYDPVGRLSKSVLNASGQNTEIAYEYDLTGNVKSAKHTYDGMVFDIGYEYDEKGNVTKITYPSGYSVSYEYDLYGRVIRVPQFVEGLTSTSSAPGTGGGITVPTQPNPKDPIIDDPDPIDVTMMSFAPLSNALPGVKYKANGFMEEMRYVNGVTTVFTDDSLGRIRTIKNPVYELTYGYDGKGNVTSITGNNGVAVASSYTYYDNDWLKGATQGQNVYAYGYDAAGNCTTKTINGVSTSYVYDPLGLNLLTSVNGSVVEHDARGNMIDRKDTGYTYTYDQSNQLTNVLKSGNNVGKYSYNSEGKRYKKVENGQSTYYVYSGEMLLYELNSDGAVHYIYLNGKQIAKVERKNGVDKRFFYHTDHLGSTRAITDEQGNVTGRFEYQPFGLEENTVTGDDVLTFTGKTRDDSTGLMYFNARYYDPTLGRFITEDPAKDGENWYVYCKSNPLVYVDINGNTCYVFYDPKSFSYQAHWEKILLKVTYNTQVKLKPIKTETEFIIDWNGMEQSVEAVSLLFHGGPWTINIDYQHAEYLTTLKNGKTPSGTSDAFYIGALQEKNIGVLNILTCNGGHQDFDNNVAATFFDTQNVEKVVAWDGSLSYTAAGWGIYVPRLANDQSHFYKYSASDRKPKGEVMYVR